MNGRVEVIIMLSQLSVVAVVEVGAELGKTLSLIFLDLKILLL